MEVIIFVGYISMMIDLDISSSFLIFYRETWKNDAFSWGIHKNYDGIHMDLYLLLMS